MSEDTPQKVEKSPENSVPTGKEPSRTATTETVSASTMKEMKIQCAELGQALSANRVWNVYYF